MSMRIKTTLLIIMIVFATTAVNFFSSLFFTNNSMQTTMDQDLEFAIGIADNLVGTSMNLMKAEARTVAAQLRAADSNETLRQLMAEQIDVHEDISALALFNKTTIITSYSEPQHDHQIDLDSDYLKLVYEDGATIMSSPFYCAVHGEYVINVYTPMGGGEVLAVTMPGTAFSAMLAKHRLWETGDIFMLNEVGMFIGAADQEIIDAMNNYLADNMEKSETNGEDVAALIQKILSEDSGVERYNFNGVDRICAYSRIDDSAIGWRVAVTVPLSESPQANALKGYIYSAVLFLIIGVVAAFFLSRVTARPFKRIEDQNRDLEKMNETITAQAAEIREEHTRVKLLTNATPLGFNLWNKDIQNIETNDIAVELFGLESQQEYLERFFELSPEYQPDGRLSKSKTESYVEEVFSSGYHRFEWMHQKPDGTPMPMEITLVRIAYDGDFMVAGYMRDLREYKEMIAAIEKRDSQLEAALEDARNANSAKSHFLAHMSHEMRTPLNAVIGLSELTLGEQGLSGEAAVNLEKIYGAGSTILGIVNDILDISKIESGKFELHPVEYDTPSLINDIVSLNIVRIGEKPITFNLYVDENLPGMLYGDDLRVKQIFNNLLSNAFKYTNDGKVDWRISFERDGDDVWLVSSVSDTGIGIKADDIKKLFSDYNQVDINANRMVEGTGLGLAITKRLVETTGGDIAVTSEYGKGTTFSVRLRQTSVSGKEAPLGSEIAENLMSMRYILSKRSRNAKLAYVDLSYAYVLVVDDIATNLDVAKGMMKPYGLNIDCASSGQQAVDMIRSGEPIYAAVFMDHMMPGMDGVETTRIIREEIGTDYAKNIPIIALTANAILGNEEILLHSGFQDFISKPIDLMKLDATLRLWVRDKSLEKEVQDSEAAAEPVPGVDAAEKKSLLGGVSIPGVDLQKALGRFGGDEEVCIDVLRSYANNTRPLLENLRLFLAAESLSDYAIVVHGIKGSSYGIFAQDAGNVAEELEREAKAGEYAAVKALHPRLEEITEALIEGIQAVLSEIDAASDKPVEPSPNPELLYELRDACKAFDMDRVDSIMNQLESVRYERGGGIVSWLREEIDKMEFEEIIGGEWPEE